MTSLSSRRWLTLTVAIIVLLLGFIGGLLWALSQETTDSEIRLGKDLAPIKDDRLLVEQRIALQIWGPVCDGNVVVTVAPLSGNRAGLASWMVTPNGERTSCAIVISDRRWKPARRCQILVHEWGHLAGQEHSSNPRSVMFPRVSDKNIPSSCS